MDEKRQIEQNVMPVFAPDYVNHDPVEFSLTNLVNDSGDRRLAFTFIDHVIVPEVGVRPDGSMQHGARIERRYRSTVVIDEELWDQMVAMTAKMKKQS
jgi:hypothetical protein